ncbi:hypothetical protein LTR53_007416 [Teratosphaeriaceae sp. CCFEE 6253]|nr:hypothetical protein LTR53_007416 [Teratosphaeriaceae sp. CCFEE 6253]
MEPRDVCFGGIRELTVPTVSFGIHRIPTSIEDSSITQAISPDIHLKHPSTRNPKRGTLYTPRMCCRRRQQRAPVAVTLGKKVYDRYQEHKAEKQAKAQSQSLNAIRSCETSKVDAARIDMSEKTEIAPPSYQEAVTAQRTTMSKSQQLAVASKQGWIGSSETLRDYDGEDSNISNGASRWLSRRT